MHEREGYELEGKKRIAATQNEQSTTKEVIVTSVLKRTGPRTRDLEQIKKGGKQMTKWIKKSPIYLESVASSFISPQSAITT